MEVVSKSLKRFMDEMAAKDAKELFNCLAQVKMNIEALNVHVDAIHKRLDEFADRLDLQHNTLKDLFTYVQIIEQKVNTSNGHNSPSTSSPPAR